MKSKIDSINLEIDSFSPATAEDIEAFRIKMLGKKGLITSLFSDFRDVPATEKKEVGQLINTLKNKATEVIESNKLNFKGSNTKNSSIDLSIQQ